VAAILYKYLLALKESKSQPGHSCCLSAIDHYTPATYHQAIYFLKILGAYSRAESAADARETIE